MTSPDVTSGRTAVMDVELESIQGADRDALNLGHRLRDLRRAKAMTLADVSAAVGVSVGTLSQIERGLAPLSVRTIFSLSSLFGVSPAWLIDPNGAKGQDADNPFVTRREHRRPVLEQGGLRKLLASPDNQSQLRGYMIDIQPGSGSGDAPYTHAGEEIGIVMEGSLDLEIDGRVHVLRAGDTFCFSSSQPHRFKNSGKTVTTVFWVNQTGEKRPPLLDATTPL
jgi:transcriptional regulator with XRE-family HTH domain